MPTATGQYVEFRADGWPLCPRCGDDELFCRAMLEWDGMKEAERPTLRQCSDSGMRCYRCGWESREF